MPATSGSFVRGNYSGRAFNTYQAIQNIGVADSSSYFPAIGTQNIGVVDSSSVQSICVRDRTGEVGQIGYVQGLAFGAPTSLDGQGSFGRHMQVGVNEDMTIGNPSPPSLRLDIPGFWRFRWTVPLGSHTVSVLTMQNSTGSYRPSMVVKANKVLGLNTDVVASASYVPGWTTIGPIAFTVTSSVVVWVELHNNNFAVPNIYGSVQSTTPAYFDHIVVK